MSDDPHRLIPVRTMTRSGTAQFPSGRVTFEACRMTTQHILLTALGREQRNTVYELHGSTVEEPLAPLALLRLLPQDARPNRVLALCTDGAKQATWETFANGVRRTLDMEAERLDIPDGKTADEIRQIVETAAEKFQEGVDLTLDVTQGLRHFPFVAYALALYLTSLRGIRLRGAYYGMLEGFARDSKEPRPIVDLRSLLELPEWFHAVRVFRETGSTGPLAGLMRGLRSESPRDAEVDTIVTSLEKLSFTYEAGLPVELAYAAEQVTSSFARGLPTTATTQIPLANQVLQLLTDSCHLFQTRAVAQEVLSEKQEAEWKNHIAVDDDELRRQANLIDLYLFRNQMPLALGMMREWVVSLLLAHTGRGAKWLDGSWNGTRSIAERRLGALAALQRDKTGRTASGIALTEEQKKWAIFWNQLADLRNELHHHGMKKRPVRYDPPELQKVKEFWSKLKDLQLTVPEFGGGHGRLLITALGTTPGVLYSALCNAGDVSRCLIVCSEQSQPSVPEAAKQAGFLGECKALVISDPHGGYTEDEQQRFRAEASRWLLESDEIFVNLTGGTTLMGMAVQHLMDRGRDLNRPCIRFVLIDRRPPEQQRSEPYVRGEIRRLDKPEGDNHADD